MSETNNKVTVRFESTVENRENDNTETLLLSGPIEIFATVDNFDELQSQETLEVIYNEIIVNKTVKNPIIYVADVRDIHNENDYTNRGAYFRCDRIYVNDKNEYSADWREILLGTHSHSNINALEKLYELSKQADVENKVIALDANGEFCLVSMEDSQSLPPLPIEIQEKIDALKRYDELHEPLEYEWNHLDAPLDQLDNTYDWMEKDENGNYKNLAVGNCRELYRNLLISEEKLYISDNYTLSNEGKYWISLDVYKVNFDTSKSYDDAVNVRVSSLNTKFFVASLDLSENVSDNDEIFIMNNGVMLSDEHYAILERKQKSLSVLFNRADQQFKDICTVTILIVRDAKEVVGFRPLLKMSFDNSDITLIEINNKLIEKYIRNEFAKKPLLPKLYLSTDEYGNMVWDNKLLPSQTFYAETIRVDIANIETVVKHERDCVKIVFKNANYRVGEDFPLLMVNDFFVFNVKPDVTESGKDVIYYLPISPISGEGHYDFELIEPGEYRDVTLVLIKNSSAGSIADEIAEKYVSKEDAVAILSHGKINLKDFVRKTELVKFSKLDHTHSQYALKDHNHDARYANFHHTHPEILLAVARETGIEAEKIDQWITNLETITQTELKAVLDNIGIVSNEDNYYIEDISVRLTTNSENILREFSGKYNIPLPLDDNGLTVKDALEIIIRAFELDTVTDDQVLLEDDIPVRLVNGPIGGITENKIYKEGTSLQTILQDIFNPYISVETMKRYLTPDENTILRWWKYDSSNELYEVYLDKLQYSDPGTLLFTIELNNSENRNCKETIVQDGLSMEIATVVESVKINDVELDFINNFNQKYFIYSNDFNFNDDQEMSEIRVSWKSSLPDDKIYDNYGKNDGLLNPENAYLIFSPEISIDYPDYFYGGAFSVDNIVTNIENAINGEGEYTVKYESGDGVNFKVYTSETPIILVAVEGHIFDKGINIFDTDSHMNITKFFKELEYNGNSYILLFNEKQYVCLYYESLDNNSELNLSLSLNSCKVC